jgi:Tfp pilus assembly protein FimT
MAKVGHGTKVKDALDTMVKDVSDNPMMPKADSLYSGSAGWTVMQVVMTVCVILILSTVTAKPLSGLVRRIRVQNAADGMKHYLLNARMRAVASPDRHCGVVFKFHAAGSLLNDSVFAYLDANPPDNHYVAGTDQLYLSAYVVPRNQKITVAVPAGLPTEVVFRGDGSATVSAKVTLTLQGFKDTLDVLASTGRVKVTKH